MSDDELDRVRIDLVRSYVAAGLLDRAEDLLAELKTAKAEIRIAGLIQGIAVYQLEKEWSQAIATGIELLKICPADLLKSYQLQTSHFYCELAELEIEKSHPDQAKELLQQAFQMDRSNVRSSILLGGVEAQLGNYKEAIKALKKISQQDSSFVAEAFLQQLECYKKLGKNKQTQKFIARSLQEHNSAKVLLAVSNDIEASSGASAAWDFILEQLELNPSLDILDKALRLMTATGVEPRVLELFHTVLAVDLSSKAMYRCESCGFELKNLHWLCPSCSTWGSVKPVS